MRRGGVLGVALALSAGFGAMGAAGAPTPSDRAEVERRLEAARERAEDLRGTEQVLTEEVSGYSARIRLLEARLGPLRAEAASRASEAETLRRRLRRLGAQLAAERRRLAAARRTLGLRREVLAGRLRDLYAHGEPDPILVLMESGSLSAAVETTDALGQIVEGDQALVDSLAAYANDVRVSRDRIAAARADVARSEQRARAAAAAAQAAAAGLARQRSRLGVALASRHALLGRVTGDRAQLEAEAEGLARRSRALSALIVRRQAAPPSPAPAPAASAAPPSTPPPAAAPAPAAATPSAPPPPSSSSGLAWPVNGTITSTFGPR